MRSYYEQPRKELRTASEEIGASPKVKDELRADCADLFKMIAGTERDADEVLHLSSQKPRLRRRVRSRFIHVLAIVKDKVTNSWQYAYQRDRFGAK